MGWRVGDAIHFSSGGTVREGTIVEVRPNGHVKVDSWPVVIPPAWIVEDRP